MIINISITNKRPDVDGAPVIVCNNKGSYTTQFTFDDEWNAYTKKVVRFVWIQKGKVKFKDVEMTGTTCTVPALSNTDKVRVGVFAGDICTTAPAVIPCVRSILCEGGTPSVENDKYYANRARESADRAEVAAGNAAASAATAASEAAEAATAAAEAEVTRLVGELGVVQTIGDSHTAVMSQKANTRELDKLSEDIVNYAPYVAELSVSVDNIRHNKKELHPTSGVVDTDSLVSVSDYIPCRSGDTLVYALSAANNNCVIMTFDGNKLPVRSIAATGYANIVEGVITFEDGERYFVASGANSATYRENYVLKYNNGINTLNKVIGMVEGAKNACVPYEGAWVNGNIVAGALKNQVNRARFEAPVYAETDIRLHIADGYRVYVYYYSADGTFEEQTDGWKTGMYTIQGGRWYNIMAAAVDEAETDVYFNVDILSVVLGVESGTVQHDLMNAKNKADFATPFINELAVSVDAINVVNHRLYKGQVRSYTTSNTAVSDYIPCRAGDMLEYALSTTNGDAVLMVTDKNRKPIRSVLGTGNANIISGTITFEKGEAYFIASCANAESYRKKYSLAYKNGQNRLETMQAAIKANEEAIKSGAAPLPDYYADYMLDRIATVQNLDVVVGNHGDSLVFVTDQHWSVNKKNSPNMIRRILAETSVAKVINGGDIIDANETQGEALSILRAYRDAMYGTDMISIMGNHDDNSSGNADHPEAHLTDAQYYGTMLKRMEKHIDTDGKIYFSFDNESMKIRYIVPSINFTETGVQSEWFKAKLTEKGEGWTVLVIMHYLYGSVVGTLHTIGQRVINAINSAYERMGAVLIGILAGHTHVDSVATESTNGYQLITTTCDSYARQGGDLERTPDSVTEQAFDVVHIDTATRKVYMTRFGAGTDREISY